jgi:hypothetical protein
MGLDISMVTHRYKQTGADGISTYDPPIDGNTAD